jgi:membrane protease YdiL (CAAX protease family)
MIEARAVRRPGLQTGALQAVVAALGLAALAARAPGYGALVVTTAVGLVAMSMPQDRLTNADKNLARRLLVTGAGSAAFFAARSLGPGLVVKATPLFIFANSLAAIAEEAFFRRFLYARLTRLGPGAAVAITALAFALVHVPAYGWEVLPIDMAAGLVLGWQRWASQSWLAPALTHLLANLMQIR